MATLKAMSAAKGSDGSAASMKSRDFDGELVPADEAGALDSSEEAQFHSGAGACQGRAPWRATMLGLAMLALMSGIIAFYGARGQAAGYTISGPTVSLAQTKSLGQTALGGAPVSAQADKELTTAAKEETKIKAKASEADQLTFYALYMQSTVGDCKTARPEGPGGPKWDAWNSLKGMKKSDAEATYTFMTADVEAVQKVK